MGHLLIWMPYHIPNIRQSSPFSKELGIGSAIPSDATRDQCLRIREHARVLSKSWSPVDGSWYRHGKNIFLEIVEEEYSDPDVIRLCNRIWRHAHGIFAFVTEPGVGPTNNWAETNIRPAVVMRKNSYGNQSVRGADTQASLMSVFRTMELQERRVVPYTLEILEAEIQSRHSEKYQSVAARA